MGRFPQRAEIGLRKRQFNPAIILGIIIYIAIVFGPFAILVYDTFSEQNDFLALVVPSGRRLHLLLNSLKLSFGVAVVAALIGWCGAVALWITRRGIRFPVIGLILPLVVLPPYIHALTWIRLATFAKNAVPGMPISSYGFWACLWVEVSGFVPLAFCFAWFGLRNIDPELIEVARLSRSDWDSLRRIALPLSAPATLTGATLIFLLSLLDYSIPSLMQFNVYSLEIFAEYSASNLPGRAFAVSLPLMIISTLCIAITLRPLRTLTLRNLSFRPTWMNPPRLPLGFWAFLVVMNIVFISQITLPIANLITSGITVVPSILETIRPDIVYSFYVAGLAAVLSLPIALWNARYLMAKAWYLWFVFLLPAAIPSALVGIGYTTYRIHSSFPRDVLPAFVGMARFLPLAVLISIAQLRRADALLFDAAQIFQPVSWRRLVYVTVPVLMPGLLTSFATVFALTLSELGATLMVIPPGRATLTLRVYNYLHYGASDIVAGICLILMLIVFGTGSIASTGVSRRRGSSVRREEA